MTTSTAKWYVYTLTDPRCGSVFYVGKGCGSRIEQHERDAANSAASTKKLNKIRSIWAADLPIEKAHVAYFWEEQDAYDHETDLIAEIGLAKLTNIHPGGQKAFDRRLVERKRREAAPEPLHVVLKRSGPEFFRRLAEWFRAGGHMGATFKFTAIDPAYRLQAAISEACYNKIFPKMWDDIRKDEQSSLVAQERLRSCGVELDFVAA